jgi:hypothetical protein
VDVDHDHSAAQPQEQFVCRGGVHVTIGDL